MWQQTLRDIKNLKIQGATAIAQKGLQALIWQTKKIKSSPDDFIGEFNLLANELIDCRPTEPLLQNGIFYVSSFLNFVTKKDLPYQQAIVEAKVMDYLQLIDVSKEQIVLHGSKLIKKNNNIFTHCHSSLVEHILINAWQKNNYNVFNTETRPLFQGRITANNLAMAGIPVTMTTDSAAEFLISNYSGPEHKMNLVILGADSISWQGDVYNKIGSYGIALAAWEAKVPVYIAAMALKMDADNKITIEERSEDELWAKKPPKVKILNYAFDRIPAKFIKGIITEFGIIKPSLLKGVVKKNHPWLIHKS